MHDEVDQMEEILDKIDEAIDSLKSGELKVQTIDDVRAVLSDMAELFEEDLIELTSDAYGLGVEGVGRRS